MEVVAIWVSASRETVNQALSDFRVSNIRPKWQEFRDLRVLVAGSICVAPRVGFCRPIYLQFCIRWNPRIRALGGLPNSGLAYREILAT